MTDNTGIKCKICGEIIATGEETKCETCNEFVHATCLQEKGCPDVVSRPAPIPCAAVTESGFHAFTLSIRNVFLVANNTIVGVTRGVVLNVMMVLAMMMIIASTSTTLVEKGAREMLIDTGLASISVLGAMIAILTGFTLIPNEIENRTIYPIISKPVRRWQFVLGKFFGAAGINGITTGILSVLLMVVYAVKFKEFDSRLVMAVIMLYFMQVVLSSLIIFFSTFMSWIGTIIVSMVVWALGNYSYFIKELTEGDGITGFTKYLIIFVQKALPNFQSMDLRYAIVNEHVVKFSPIDIGTAFLNGSIFLVIALVLASIIFSYREL
jgi:ABC-type transport system involved in multi-copper enzyme maturation permease subunit